MDKLTPAARSANMRRIRSTGTAPEALVARLLRREKIKYTRLTKDLPGRPDFMLPGARLILMVHGCFWHQHPACREGRIPSSNVGYWKAKLQRNQRRDAAVARRLRRLGWRVAAIWECQLKDAGRVARRLQRLACPATAPTGRAAGRARVQ